jgi:PAS domain S-box-containing protein
MLASGLASRPHPGARLSERGTLALASGLLVAIAALDAVVGERAVLIELLLLGPIVAATGASVRATALVALAAVALALPLGLTSDAFGSLEHLTSVLAVAIGGAIAVVVARLRVDRERAVASARDSQRRAEDARAHVEAMLRGVADGVTAQAPDGSLLFANDAAVKMLGFASSEELLGSPPERILSRLHPLREDGTPFPPAEFPGRRALEGEEAPEAVVRFRVSATGEELWSKVKSTPVRDPEGGVTMAINVIEDITDSKRAEWAQRFLSRASDALAARLDMDTVLERIAVLAIPERAEWCAVDLVGENDELERVALTHADPERRQRALELVKRYPPDPASDRGAYEVLRTGRSMLIPRVPDELLRAGARDERHYELLKEFGIRSALVVPMLARDRVLGVLTFVNGEGARVYDEEDLAVAEELARRCATAIENARLYSERAYIARTLQQSLLPVVLPDVPGIEAAARFRPAGEGSEVGGDFYDMFKTGASAWTVVMGDVCGKGPDAAAVTALARYTLRAAAMREGSPSRSLEMLNEALLRQRDDRRFCTVAYANLQPNGDATKVALALGGHPLPLLLRANGAVEAVGRPGTLLGVVRDPSIEDTLVSLDRGDALVLFTDGLIEPRSERAPLDEGKLEDELAMCAGRDADAIASHLERAALDAREGRTRDDIALLVLRVSG